VQAASGKPIVDSRVEASWWDALDAAGHGLLAQSGHKLLVPMPLPGSLSNASRLMHVVLSSSATSPAVQAWLLLAVAKAVSGGQSFSNRVQLAAAVPHPLDALARLMRSTDVGIQRACMYELSMLSSLSLSARQLKFLLSILREDPGDIPKRAWGIVGTLRRMVMVSRNETRIPRIRSFSSAGSAHSARGEQ